MCSTFVFTVAQSHAWKNRASCLLKEGSAMLLNNHQVQNITTSANQIVNDFKTYTLLMSRFFELTSQSASNATDVLTAAVREGKLDD